MTERTETCATCDLWERDRIEMLVGDAPYPGGIPNVIPERRLVKKCRWTPEGIPKEPTDFCAQWRAKK